jgi:glycosyltransferase involved in cell wall biosynthesis
MQPELDERLGFQPDIYQRYGFLARLIDAIFRAPTATGTAPVGKIRLLDVGSGPVRLTETFLPDWMEVTRTDVSTFDDPAIVCIEPDGSLPFADGSVDVVLAMDVLEHLPADQRARVIAECRRVAGRCVIVAGPVHTPEVVAAERSFAELARTVSGRELAFLAEHAQFGLPDAGDITGAFDGREWHVVTADNSPLAEWQLFNAVDFIYSCDLGEGERKQATNSIINGRAPFRRAHSPHYRMFVCGFRESADAAAMRQLISSPEGVGEPITAVALARSSAELMSRVRLDLRTPLEKALGEKNALIAEKDALISGLDGVRRAIDQKDAHIGKLTALLQEASDRLLALERTVNDQNAALADTERESAARLERVGDLERTLSAMEADTARESAARLERVEDLERTLHARKQLIASLEHRLETRHAQYARAIPSILQARRVEQELADQADISERLQHDVEALQGALDTIYASRSWKLSGPLRSLGGAIRRLRAGGADRPDRLVTTSSPVGAHERLCAIISATPLFDPEWYRRQAPAAAAAPDPLMHYVECGSREGRSPHPLFDSAFYLERNPDVAAAGDDPLLHYLSRGWLEGRNPHPLFDATFYLAQNPDVAAAGVNPLVHYATCGAREGRSPHPVFDSALYFAGNPDVAAAGSDPLTHYITHGAAEGRQPHPLVDPAFYASQTPETAASDTDALTHYLTRGAQEGLDPHPLFNTSFYVEQNPDVAATGMNPLAHYLLYGAKEGRDPHPLFDSSFYLAENPDVEGAEINPLVHFVLCGASEGRDPHASFDSSFYLEQNPDVATAGLNPLTHYVMRGSLEGRRMAAATGSGPVLDAPEPGVDYVPPHGLLPWFNPLNIAVSEALSSAPRLNVLVPGLAMRHMSGGPNTAIALACALAARGVRVRFVSTDSALDPDRGPFWDHLRTLTGVARLPPHMEIVDGFDRLQPLHIGANDLFLATAWWTAQQAKYATQVTNQRTFLYLIQDYEPLLHAASTQHALAGETYDLPHVPIINTSLLHEFLTTRRIGRFGEEAFARSALVFEPALDQGIFHPQDALGSRTRRRLLFYARPTNGLRNLFEMGVAALQKAIRDEVFAPAQWEFVGMGEAFAPVALGAGAVLHPAAWVNLEGYARQMRESDVLLSLMLSPHPSYPPLEMAASGGVAVTTTFANKTAERLARLSPNIIGVDATIEAIAAGLHAAVRRLPHRDERRQNAQVPLPRTWAESFEPILPRLLDELSLLQGSPALPVHVRTAAGTPDAAVFPGFREWAGSAYDLHRRIALAGRREAYPDGDARLVSFLTPVWNTDPAFIDSLAGAVFGQDAGTDFEWIVLDNGSTRTDTRDCLARLARHPSVQLHRVDQNLGIVGGMRNCLERARHRYVIPLDSDDLLTPDALRVLTHAIHRAGCPAVAYTDEDKLDGESLRDPYFKPDWDPILFMNSCYIAHLCAIDRRLALELGVYTDPQTDGCHDWDTFTRFHLAGHVPLHVPETLYTWRMHAGSTSGNIQSKPYVFASHQRVLNRVLAAAPNPGLYQIEQSPLFDGTPDWRIRRAHRDPWPVTTVVVTPDAGHVSREQVRSDLPHEILAMDTSHGLHRLQEIATRCAGAGRLVHLLWGGTTIEDHEWPWEAMTHFELYPDTVMIGGRVHDGRRIRMASCYFGFGSGCDSPDRGRALDDPGYFAQMWKQHTVSAVSVQHCVIQAAFLQDALGPLAASGVSGAGLGPWLGAAARKAGRRIVYSPFFCASSQIDPEAGVGSVERAAFRSAHRALIPENRYLSPSLGLGPRTAYRPVSASVRVAQMAEATPGLAYQDWTDAQAMARAVTYGADADHPTFSLLTTLYSGSKADVLRATARSLFEQTRKFAEWVILVHGPVAPDVDSVVAELASDPRVRVLRKADNVGIVNGLRLCLEHASGDYVVPMDADDLLTPDALHVLGAEIRTNQPGLIYTDEDMFQDGTVMAPFFRPAFDPIFNAENSYVWHLCAFRRDQALRLGAYSDAGAEFCHDWDTISRFAAAGSAIAHARHVLYHWRTHAASQSNSGTQNPGSLASTRFVLTRTIAAQANPDRYQVVPFPIFRGAEEWCIQRLSVDPPPLDGLVLRDGPADADPSTLIQRCGFPFRAAHETGHDAPESWAMALRQAAHAGSEYVLVVTGEIDDLDQSGIWEAVKLFEMHPEVAVVSGRLVSGAGTVVECGSVLDDLGRLISPFAGLGAADPGPFAMALKAHCIVSPAQGLFVARRSFLERALERQPPGLDLPALPVWLAACAAADNLRVAYSPLLQARIPARGPVRQDDDGGPRFTVYLERLGAPGSAQVPRVTGTAGFLNAQRVLAGGPPAGTTAAFGPGARGERLEPVSG